jgi:hypothetical protein
MKQKDEYPFWHTFEQLNRIFESEEHFQKLMSTMEKTCIQLRNIIETGGADERRRAQTALTAYGQTLQMIHEVGTQIREST